MTKEPVATGVGAPAGAVLDEPAQPARIWNRAFIAICVTNALISVGLQMCNVLIGKYTNSLGATAALVGVVSSAFAWSAIVFKLISAPTLDAFNRKKVVMIAIAAIGIAFLGYGIAGNVSELLAFRLLQGAGQAFTTTCFIAMAADALPRERIGTGLGFFALGAGVAQMVGPVISLKVSEAYGYSASFFIAAAVMVVALFSASRIKLEYRKTKRFSFALHNVFAREVIISASLMFLLFTCYSLVNPFLAIHAGERGIGSDISYFFTLYAAVLFLSRPLSGRLADKFGYIVLVPMLGLFILAFILISVATTLWMFLLASVLFGFGYGGCQPVLQSLAMRLAPKERRGAASSTNFIGSDLGNIVGPVVGGGLATSFGFTAMWQGMTVTLVISAILVVVLRGVITRKVAAVAAAA